MANLILPNVSNYQAKLEQGFLNFLIAQGASGKTKANYIVDLRNFLNWFFNSLKTHQQDNQAEDLLKLINLELLENYKSSLILEHVPTSTINRRFSSLRLFFKSAVNLGLIIDDPSFGLSNIPKNKLPPVTDHEILDLYIKQSADNSDPETDIEGKKDDVSEFLHWLKIRKTTK